MNYTIEKKYVCNNFLELLQNLKASSDLITIIIRSDGCYTSNSHTGSICKVICNSFVLLINNERKTFIPIDAIATIIISDDDRRFDKEGENREDQRLMKEDSTENDQQVKEDSCDQIDGDKNNEERDCQVYGYGRKIRINFKRKREMPTPDINITELTVLISPLVKSQRNFIQYFHKDNINNTSIELLLEPLNCGSIYSVINNEDKRGVIIKGRALIYVNSQNKGEGDFELIVTNNTIRMKIKDGDEIIDDHSETLVGFCGHDEEPFVIEEDIF